MGTTLIRISGYWKGMDGCHGNTKKTYEINQLYYTRSFFFYFFILELPVILLMITVFKEEWQRRTRRVGESWEMCQHISQVHDNMKGNDYDTPGYSHAEDVLKTNTVVQYVSADLPITDSHMTSNSAWIWLWRLLRRGFVSPQKRFTFISDRMWLMVLIFTHLCSRLYTAWGLTRAYKSVEIKLWYCIAFF